MVRLCDSRHALLWALLCAIPLACMSPARVPESEVMVVPGTPTPPPVDFAEFLTGRDLVVEGTLSAVDTVVRTPLGGCGSSGFPARAGQDYTIQISRVIYGTAEDSSIIISDLVRDVFPPGVLVPGARVIGWGFRNCIDGWRLWGNVAVVTAGGHLVGHIWSEEGLWVKGQPKGQPIAFSTLDAMLVAKASNHGANFYHGKKAVALVRLTDIVVQPTGGVSYTCDSLGWIMGSATRVPQYLDFPQMPFCYYGAHRGDSLTVPVPEVFVGDRLSVGACPKALQVKNGYAPGFGVPLEYLPWAIEQQETGLAVRPFLEQE